MAYEYITNNNLYEKQTYMYSKYRGVDFLKDYLDSRYQFIDSQKRLEGDIFPYAEPANDPVQEELMDIFHKLKAGDHSREIMDRVNAYTKSFEVRKRLYSCYNSDSKPIEGAGFENYQSYLLFADCLLNMYQHTGCLKYFSCLLKLNDTVLSVQDCLTESMKECFCQIIRQELDIFYQLARKKGIDVEVVR